MSTFRPNNRLKLKEKDEDWRRNAVTYWMGRANSYPIFSNEALALYSAASGKLREELYTYVTNPLNTDRPNLKGYPARMRNIDILSPNINLLLGELNNRFFNPVVIALNTDIDSQREKAEFELRVEALKRDFINSLIQEGLVEEEIAQTPLPDEIIKKTVSGLKDQMSLMGQQALDVILKDKRIDVIRRRTLYDFIVLSRFITYKDIRNDDIVYEYISPIEVSFVNSPNLLFIQDSEAVKRTVSLPLTQITEILWEYEEYQEILPELEKRATSNTTAGMNVGFNITNTGDINNPQTPYTGGFLLEHVNFSSMKLLKRVSGVDEFGNFYKEDYDEDYKPLPGEKVEEYWVTQKWEGYRVDGQYIIGVQPIEFLTGTYENPSSPKNLYNGRVFQNGYVVPESLIEKGIVYQIKYNVIHYYLEKTLAKNKDKLTVFPLGMIPKKEGWDEFTMMYYADAHGYLFLDETDPQVMQALQYIKSIDMSMSAYIKDMYGLLSQIKNDWDEVCGISRQRKGQSMASDGKAVTQEAVYRSSVISEEFFKQHEETIVEDLQGLIDLSQIAWRTGKKGTYVNSDYKTVHYNLDPSVYPFSQYSIYVENSSKTTRELELLKSQIGTIAQQTQNLSIIPKIARATNLAKLEEEIAEIEMKLQKSQEAQSEAEQQFKEQELADKENERQLKIYEIDENNETKKEIALINAQSNIMSYQEGDNSGEAAKLEDLYIKREEQMRKREEMYNKLQLEREKLKEEKAKRIEEAKLTRENMVNDLEIAKQNSKNRAKKQKS